MLSRYELLFDLINKQKDCEFSLRFIISKEKEIWKNMFSLLSLVKKGTRKDTNFDYGEVVLGERILPIRKGMKVIKELFPTKEKKGRLVIPDYTDISIDGVYHKPEFKRSKKRYSLLKNNWPEIFCSFSVSANLSSNKWNRDIVSKKLPYYPDLNEAIRDFFNIDFESFSDYGQVYVKIPDYRTRIKSLKVIFSKVEITIDNPEITFKQLLLKIFAKAKKKFFVTNIVPEQNKTVIDFEFQPERLSVGLLSLQDGSKLDVKEFNKWSLAEEGIFIERPVEEILALTKEGESQTLEYKYDVIDVNTKNDFIESVVAFLNTNRGIILIGVDDKGNIIGSKKNVEDIQKIIHDSCEPPPKEIRIEETLIENAKIIIVEVPEGDNPPYQSKRDKNWYVRHNSTDMKMERSELMEMTSKEKSYSYFP